MAGHEIQATEFELTAKAWAAFGNMRTNLALATSFERRSGIRPADWDGTDLRFRGLAKDWTQPQVHNITITLILVALTYQALKNYGEMKDLLPRLEDPDVERFLDTLEDRHRFVRGMEMLRNGVFHVRRRPHPDIRFFGRVCVQRGGAPAVISAMLDALYAFTDKVFTNELTIWPLGMAEAVEKLDRQAAAEGRMTFAEFSEIFDDFMEGKITSEEYVNRVVGTNGSSND